MSPGSSQLVNFFIVGAAKSGTTSLTELFKSIAQVDVPIKKEPFYFVEGTGVSSYEEYKNLFTAGNVAYRMDASTGYLFDPECARKIYDYNPRAKILIILRNPIDFMISYWEYMSTVGNESLSFEECLEIDVVNYRKSSNFEKACGDNEWPANYRYFDRALFAEQVARYLEVFPASNVKIILFEDLFAQQKALEDIFDFLQLKCPKGTRLPKANKSGTTVPIVKSIRKSLYLSPIKKLLKPILGIRLYTNVQRFLVRISITQRNYKKLSIDSSQRKDLIERLSGDVKKLKSLLPELDFNSWRDFN